MPTLPKIADAMQDLFGSTAEAFGRATGFCKRERLLTASIFLKTLVFGWLHNPDASLAELCATAGVLGVPVSEQAIDQRFTPEATNTIKLILEEAVQRIFSADSHPHNSFLKHFTNIEIFDSTTITLPPTVLPAYPEFETTSSTATSPSAAMKISASYDFALGKLRFSVVNGNAADSGCPEPCRMPEKGSLAFGDLAYYDLETFRTYGQNGVYWFTRHKANTAVQTFDGAVHPKLSAFLDTQTKDVIDIDVILGKSAQLPARLVAMRLSDDSAKLEHQKILDNAKKKGESPSEESLKLSKWVVFETNVPREMLNTQQVLTLGRIRWQIELLFREWKELGQIDKWRTKNPHRIMCEIYAKLLGVLVIQWMRLDGVWSILQKSVVKANKCIRNWAMLVVWSLQTSKDLLLNVLELLGKTLSKCRQDRRVKKPGTWQWLEMAMKENGVEVKRRQKKKVAA